MKNNVVVTCRKVTSSIQYFILIYINDLLRGIKYSSVFLYANDTKFLKTICCLLDCILLQQDLYKCSCGLVLNPQLALNIAKYLYLRFAIALKTRFVHKISHIVLSSINSFNDLGILFDSKLTFSSHCHKVAAKGFARVNILLKDFYSNDRNLQCKLCSAFVRPISEYNSPIWSPYFAKDIKAIERVKKNFTKKLKGLRNKPYKEPLAILNLHTLECRRSFNDLVFLYKIIHSLSDIKLQSLYSLLRVVSIRSSFADILINFFFQNLVVICLNFRYKVLKLWKSFPEHICNASSVTIFK